MVIFYCYYLKIDRKVYIPTKENFYIVKEDRKGTLFCNCLESIFESLACRHEFCVLIKETKPISSLYIHERWTKEYFDQKELSDISDSDQDSNESIAEEEEKEGEEEEFSIFDNISVEDDMEITKEKEFIMVDKIEGDESYESQTENQISPRFVQGNDEEDEDLPEKQIQVRISIIIFVKLNR